MPDIIRTPIADFCQTGVPTEHYDVTLSEDEARGLTNTFGLDGWEGLREYAVGPSVPLTASSVLQWVADAWERAASPEN